MAARNKRKEYEDDAQFDAFMDEVPLYYYLLMGNGIMVYIY